MTYVELIVVLSIFSIMTSITIFNYNKFEAKVDIKNLNQETALHIAALSGHTNLVHVLLENKANPNLQTPAGFTPLMFAAGYDYIDIANNLLAHKARVDLKATNGWTALQAATVSQNKEITEALKKGDKVRLSTLRLLSSAFNYEKIRRYAFIISCRNIH